ncbi:hypothetical protein B0H14DRAFT_2629539 [Mycena olivaceomarginata]|nr:hypothetical protein B0H14DRAFT_2629539 [Mycena olivaceomarginata]
MDWVMSKGPPLRGRQEIQDHNCKDGNPASRAAQKLTHSDAATGGGLLDGEDTDKGIPAHLRAPEEIMALGNRHQGAAEDFRAACGGEGASLQQGERYLDMDRLLRSALGASLIMMSSSYDSVYCPFKTITWKLFKSPFDSMALRMFTPANIVYPGGRRDRMERRRSAVSNGNGSVWIQTKIEARKTLTLDAKKKDKIKDRTRARRSHGPGFQGTTLIVREKTQSQARIGLRQISGIKSKLAVDVRKRGRERRSGNEEPEARKTAESTSSRGQRANSGIGRRAEGGSVMHRHRRPQGRMRGQKRRAGAEGTEGARARDGGRDSERTARSGAALRVGVCRCVARTAGGSRGRGRRAREGRRAGFRANGGFRKRAEGGSVMQRHPRPQVPMCGQNGGREPRARKARARGTAGGIPSERRGFESALPGENNRMRQHYTYVRARGMPTSRGGFEPKEGVVGGPCKRAKCSLSERIEGTKSRRLVRRPACAWVWASKGSPRGPRWTEGARRSGGAE